MRRSASSARTRVPAADGIPIAVIPAGPAGRGGGEDGGFGVRRAHRMPFGAAPCGGSPLFALWAPGPRSVDLWYLRDG